MMESSVITAAPGRAESAAPRPLCVDLDGTLVKSDTLADSLLLLVRKQPLQAAIYLLSLQHGKAAFKARVASLTTLDVEHLPWNRPLLDYLAEQRATGRKIFMVTGADTRVARRIADYMDLFEDILASDGETNQTGNRKLATLKEKFGEGFDYIGNARADAPALVRSGQAMAANPTRRLRSLIRSGVVPVSRTFEDRPAAWKSVLKAIRPHQWAKNVLIFVPLLLAHAIALPLPWFALLAFACFSLCASAAYILNDLLDIEADRRHPKKSRRPFAAGNLSAGTGLGMAALLLAAAFGGSAFFTPNFAEWMATYFVATLAYSLWFKRVVLVDVLLLSGLYTLRLLAGAAAVGVSISPWFAAFSVFLFLSLAIVKRFSELQNIRAQGGLPANGRGYLLADIEQLRSFGTVCGLGAVLVFSLYINSYDVTGLYRHPARMWLIVPLLLWWIFRVWLLASRAELDEDPVIYAVTNRVSLLICLAIAAAAIFAAV
ncbi:MAG: UbiA family prenyltransferase [Bryobacteraceae bacterium]